MTTYAEAIPRAPLRRRVGQRILDWLPAVIVLAAGLALWEFGTRGLDVQTFLLPPLSDILETLWNDRDTFFSAGWFTFKEALGGFVIGCSAAIVFALFSLTTLKLR